MRRLFQKPASNLSAAIKTALSETQPPKRTASQKFLDLGLNEKPLGTSFAMIWFRQGKTSAKHSDSLGTPEDRAGRGGVSPALLLARSRSSIYTGTYSTLWRPKPASKTTKLGELWHRLRWKTGLKGGCWASADLEIPQLHGRASGRDLPHHRPTPRLSIFICGRNLAQKRSKLNSEMLCIYQDHSSN